MILSDVVLRNTRANQPAATAVPAGTIYYVTDETITERSNGSVWQSITDANSIISPTLRKSAWFQYFPAGSGNLPVSVGLAAFTYNVVTWADGSNADYTLQSMTGNANATLYYNRPSVSVGTVQARHDPTFYILVKTGTSISNVRFFFGFSSANTQGISDSPANSYIGFSYSTSVPDTGWVGVCKDGTTQQKTASSPIAVSTVYQLKFIVSGGGTTVSFYVNGALIGTLASNLPAGSTSLQGPLINWYNLAAEDKTIMVGRVYIEWD